MQFAVLVGLGTIDVLIADNSPDSRLRCRSRRGPPRSHMIKTRAECGARPSAGFCYPPARRYARVVIAGWRRQTYARRRTDQRANGVISFFGILRSRARERESNAPEQRHPNDQFPVSQHTKGSDRFASGSSRHHQPDKGSNARTSIS